MARTLVTLTATLFLLALAAPPAGAGGGGHDAGACAGFTQGGEVLLRDGCLDGVAHFLDAGDDLEIRNVGQMPHDYTAVDGSFRTGLLQPGERATVEAPEPGVHRVYCTLHASAEGQGMAGVLVVGDQGPEAVAAASAGGGGSSVGAGEGGSVAGALAWGGAGAALAAGAGLALAAVTRRRGPRLAPDPR